MKVTAKVSLNKDAIDKLKNKVSVTLEELYPNDFMKEHSKFNSIDDFFNKSPFKITNAQELLSIPVFELDNYVNENTSFKTWDEMQTVATDLYKAKINNH